MVHAAVVEAVARVVVVTVVVVVAVIVVAMVEFMVIAGALQWHWLAWCWKCLGAPRACMFLGVC